MDSIVSSRVKLHVSVTAITSSRRSHLTVCALLPATEVGVVGRGTPPVQSRLCDLLFFFFFGERWSATRTPFFSFLISWELELRNYELAAHAFTHSFIHSLTCSSRLIAKTIMIMENIMLMMKTQNKTLYLAPLKVSSACACNAL